MRVQSSGAPAATAETEDVENEYEWVYEDVEESVVAAAPYRQSAGPKPITSQTLDRALDYRDSTLQPLLKRLTTEGVQGIAPADRLDVVCTLARLAPATLSPKVTTFVMQSLKSFAGPERMQIVETLAAALVRHRSTDVRTLKKLRDFVKDNHPHAFEKFVRNVRAECNAPALTVWMATHDLTGFAEPVKLLMLLPTLIASLALAIVSALPLLILRQIPSFAAGYEQFKLDRDDAREVLERLDVISL